MPMQLDSRSSSIGESFETANAVDACVACVSLTGQVTCSQGGTCLTPISAAKQTPADSAAPNQPPKVQLVDVIGSSSPVVRVRRGQSYEACRKGAQFTADAPCEPGATAWDPDGSAAATGASFTGDGSTSLDLTSNVMVCPPAKCLSRGCSPTEIRRHFFTAKGLQGCGIDTMAPEGTEFKVRFVHLCEVGAGHRSCALGASTGRELRL